MADLAWGEVDLERALITLPPERVKRRLTSKNKSPHLIPLVPLAVELLRAQIRRVGADGSERDLVFGTGSNGKGWQNWSRPKAELDATIQPPIRPWRLHDFRRVGSTVMNDELGIQPWVVEACLGHVVAGVAGVYNKAQYLAWEQADTFALTTFLNQDRIIAALDADITARARDDEAMDPPTKERALAAIAAEVLTLDRELAELVLKAHAQGIGGVEMRAGVNPLAVLSLELVADLRPPPSGTSPEHVVTYVGPR
jgi:hypothetical protein